MAGMASRIGGASSGIVESVTVFIITLSVLAFTHPNKFTSGALYIKSVLLPMVYVASYLFV